MVTPEMVNKAQAGVKTPAPEAPKPILVKTLTKVGNVAEYPAILTGNLGGDVEMRFSTSGNAFSSFSIALYAGKNREEEKLTEWVRVVCFKELAEAVNQALKKGDKVQCGGLLQLHQWEGQDSQFHSRIEMTAFEVFKIDRPIKQ